MSVTCGLSRQTGKGRTYSSEMREAISEATPATIMAALAKLEPVPPVFELKSIMLPLVAMRLR